MHVCAIAAKIKFSFLCSIALHVNCKIAVFENIQVPTIAKMDTKVEKKQVLTNIFTVQ